MNTRVERLRNSIQDNEAVFISGYPNIFYYSGFTSSDARLLITHEKKYIITDSRYTIQAKQQSPDFELIDIAKGYRSIFEKLGNVEIGFEEDCITVGEHRKLEKALSKYQNLTGMQKLIDVPRRIKDKNEIKKISEAERMGDEAFSYILKKIRPGVSERDIALEIEFFMRKEGASGLSFETIAASGVRSAMPHGTASEKLLEKGDFLTLDFGCVFEGYCSDMTRTVVIGKANSRQKEIYDIVLRAQTEALKALKAGKKCSDIDAVARGIISQAGYGKNFGHGLGHSVGIQIHEMPSLSPKCDTIIENGHILTVEPGIYIEDFGGVRIEDLVAVADGEAVNLTVSDKELIEL